MDKHQELVIESLGMDELVQRKYKNHKENGRLREEETATEENERVSQRGERKQARDSVSETIRRVCVGKNKRPTK